MLVLMLTIVSSVVILMALVVAMMRLKYLVYRVRPAQVMVLLDSVLEGAATLEDWDVFLAMPIRDNPELDAVRVRCAEIAAEHQVSEFVLKFSAEGRAQLKWLRDRLRDDQDSVFNP